MSVFKQAKLKIKQLEDAFANLFHTGSHSDGSTEGDFAGRETAGEAPDLGPHGELSTVPNNKHPNIIIFGETGAGKSSIVNMLRGGTEAPTSSGAGGMTFQHQRYEKVISDVNFNVFDTVGLNEAANGKVPPEKAIEQLYTCMRQLEHGVNLLVYVMRAPRIKETTFKNYDMFFNIFCNKEVRIVIIITGLEDHDDMDKWWPNNKGMFTKAGMKFFDAACITASKGKARGAGYVYEREYEESKAKVESLIQKAYHPRGWKMPIEPWLTTVLGGVCTSMASYFGLRPFSATNALCHALQKYGNMTEVKAVLMANKLERTMNEGVMAVSGVENPRVLGIRKKNPIRRGTELRKVESDPSLSPTANRFNYQE